jgi:hypothetical protein
MAKVQIGDKPIKAIGLARQAAPTASKAEQRSIADNILRLNSQQRGRAFNPGMTVALGRGLNFNNRQEEEMPEMRVPNLDPNRALNDPIYQYYMNEALGGFRTQTAQERERLSNLYTDIYGETGQLKNFDTQATQDQRRLAAEMASRGTLRSGAYAGGERGLGTQQQKEQTTQRAGIERGYSDQTSPQALFDMGLARGADNKVRELVQGEEISWKDPSTGETKKMKYDWTQTTAGRAAKQAALQQWMQKQLAGITSVM